MATRQSGQGLLEQLGENAWLILWTYMSENVSVTAVG